MTSRDAILAAVRAARLSGSDRPDPRLPDVGELQSVAVHLPGDLVERFTVAARATAVDVLEVPRSELGAFVAERFARARRVVSMVPSVSAGVAQSTAGAPREYADTDVFVCEAALGVAENGAVWLPGTRLGQRAALFLATDVLIVLSRGAIVEDVHAAYARVGSDFGQFGIFVAGPSKTADIEQSLVMGAHGPKGMTIAMVE